MEKIIFKEKAFEYSLIGYITLLICWNFYGLLSGNLMALVPIAIQGTLLFLIFSKNKYAKIGIKIWAIILILSHGLSLLAKIVKIILGDEIEMTVLLNKIVMLTIGILIYIFNEKYVDIIKTD